MRRTYDEEIKVLRSQFSKLEDEFASYKAVTRKVHDLCIEEI